MLYVLFNSGSLDVVVVEEDGVWRAAEDWDFVMWVWV